MTDATSNSFILSHNDGDDGPYTEVELRELLALGSVSPGAYVWTTGWTEWKPVREAFPGGGGAAKRLSATRTAAAVAAGRRTGGRPSAPVAPYLADAPGGYHLPPPAEEKAIPLPKPRSAMRVPIWIFAGCLALAIVVLVLSQIVKSRDGASGAQVRAEPQSPTSTPRLPRKVATPDPQPVTLSSVLPPAPTRSPTPEPPATPEPPDGSARSLRKVIRAEARHPAEDGLAGSRFPVSADGAAGSSGMAAPVRVGYTTYQVLSANVYRQLPGDSAQRHAPDSGAYIVVKVTVRNNDMDQRTIPPFKLRDADGAEYGTSSNAVWLKDHIGLLDELNPGVSKTGLILFDAPADRAYALKVSGGYASGESTLIPLHIGSQL